MCTIRQELYFKKQAQKLLVKIYTYIIIYTACTKYPHAIFTKS